MRALLAAHPYEEPAYDLYPLQNAWTQAGSGVVGELPTPEAETDFLLRIKQTFEVGCVKHSHTSGRMIRKVALCGGAGAFLRGYPFLRLRGKNGFSGGKQLRTGDFRASSSEGTSGRDRGLSGPRERYEH